MDEKSNATQTVNTKSSRNFMADPVLTPTAEEIAEYEKLSAAAPTTINPIKDLSADDLFKLATEDSDNFDLISEFRRNQDTWKDPATIQKIADVNNRIKQRGFELSDIPGPGKIARTVFDIAKGFGKQAWNYANALVGVPIASAIGEVTGDASRPGFTEELEREGQRRVMENIAGTEAGMFGVARLGEKAIRKVTGAASNLTPEQKVSDLWKDVGTGETEEAIAQGKGGLLEPVGGEVRKELEAAGKPIRPEEVQVLAAGDPAAFYTFGKIFQGAGKLVPGKVAAGAEKIVEKAGEAAEVVGGRAIQAAGRLTELGGRAVKIAGPVVGFVKGAIEAGPLGALAGLKGGEIAAKVGGKLSKGGKALQETGKEIAGATPVTGGATQLAKDVIGGVPVAASEISKGLAFDIGTAALTSETPRDTESVGIGAFFGGLGAARRVGGRVISGQLVGPRAWGSDTVTPSSGKHPGLDAMHADATKDATPAVKTRLNAIRQFLKGSHADTDVFLAKDAQSVENAMLQSGASPEQARQFAQTEGFFVTSLPDAQGNPRRVIIARNVDAAPHESFHAIQDVLGETANQAIDQIVREEYGSQWENEGARYASRIGPGDWREVILDATGTGLNYAKEKIAMDVANEFRAATGAEPTSGFVQDRVKAILGQVMDRAVQANPNVTPNDIARHAWRDILSPQEATAVADSYLARELAAENFDMVFKHGGPDLQNVSGLTGRLARIVAQLVSTLGGEPLSPERRSQIGDIAPRFRVTEAVREAPGLVEPRVPTPTSLPKPQILPPSKPALPAKPSEPLPSPPSPPETPNAEEARTIAAGAPETTTVAGTASPREILGQVAEAISQQAGIKINYLSAPDEPAAATTSNREARRAIIETFRTMPAEARALWEKTFFPERVVKLKGDKYQVLGWAPEVFAANAHKLAAKLVELDVANASPYPIEGTTFTPEGWQSLFADTQKFVQNQMAGRTGAGDPLVVPKNITEAGFFAPTQRGAVEGLDQVRADFINMLFNFRLPDTARVQKGRLPLNIAAQDVSAATQPGRVEIPVIPRGRFEGVEAERQGISGREIMEVNPLRQQIEAAAQAKGVAMPEFIEAVQRLNLENIKDVQVAPEVPQFRGNTLTLSAGFQPSAEPRAIKSAAVRDERGKVWEGFWHGDAEDAARTAGARGPFADGFTTNGGEFLTREAAFERAKELKQIAEDVKPGAFGVIKSGLETSQLPKEVRGAAIDKAQFQPPKNAEQAEELVKSIAKMSPQEFGKWARETPGGLTEAAHQTGFNSANQGFVNLLKAAGDSFGKKAMDLAATDIESAMIVATQQQFFNEAWQAATGEGSAGFVLRKKNPNFQPKFPLDNAPAIEDTAVQMQPKKELKLKPAGRDGVSKAWVLPNGKVVNIGGQWHHDYLNENPELRKQYKLSDDTSQDNREGALKKGFARINWSYGNGHLTVEARTKDWPKQREAIRDFVEANADKIDRMQVTLLSDNLKAVDDDNAVSVFTLEDNEKSAMLPFGDIGEKRATGQASERLFEKAASKAQLQPRRKEHDYDPRDDYKLVRVEKLVRDTLSSEKEIWKRKNPDAYFEDFDLVPVKEGSLGNDIAKYVDGTGSHPVIVVDTAAHQESAERSGRLFGELIQETLRHELVHAKQEAEGRPLSEREAEAGARFQPTAVKDVAEDYAKKAGIEYRPSAERSNVPLDTAQKIADFYETAKHSPDASEVKESYAALAKETIAQYEAIKDAGYEIEPWTLEGEPYASSAEMVKDITENKHLYFLKTKDSSFGDEEVRIPEQFNVMLEQSGVDDLLVNDVFRAVHDFFGHAKENLQFGPKGEFNAWRVHSEMYSPEAQGALAAETLAQNFWVNYGKHLRREDGSVPNRGDKDFVALPDRPFAEQKNIVIPDELLSEVRAQFQPEAKEEFYARHMRKSGGPFWRYDETVGPFPSKENAEKALAGIKSLNANTGQFYSKYSVENSVPEGSRLVSWQDYINSGRSISMKEELGNLDAQFQPKPGDKDLFGVEEKLTPREISKLPRADLLKIYPEAIVPKDPTESIPSDIVGSPLYKNSEDPVKAFSDELVKFAQEVRSNPIAKAGAEWYDKFTPMLKKEFGKDAQLFAELLAATSPNTGVETNFGYALDALDSFKSGRFAKTLEKFNQGMDMIANDTWKAWYNKELKNIPNPPKKPTAATFLEHWIFKHDLKPKQTNGKLYGIHSLPVLQVFARKWLNESRGPKTLNFVENLIGKSDEATIDMWADRTMRRIGYAGQERWRILPKNVTGVADRDFEFSQKAFRHAAQRLGMKPSALQGMLWFAEKKLWADNEWADAVYGDFRKEMETIPARRAKREGLTSGKKDDKVQMNLIEPRKTRY